MDNNKQASGSIASSLDQARAAAPGQRYPDQQPQPGPRRWTTAALIASALLGFILGAAFIVVVLS